MLRFCKAVFLCAIFLQSIGTADAQLNAIAGYDISYTDVGPVNQMLSAFNEKYTGTIDFKDVNVLHGFAAGFRYHYDLGALELVYNRRFTRRIGDQFVSKAEESPMVEERLLPTGTNADFFYEIRTLSLGTEFGGAFRIGGTLDLTNYLMQMDYDDPKYKDAKVKQHPLGSRVYVGAHLENRRNISFSVRGYYQFFWSDVSTLAIRQRLDLLDDDDCFDCTFRPTSFGITIMINNGLQ